MMHIYWSEQTAYSLCCHNNFFPEEDNKLWSNQSARIFYSKTSSAKFLQQNFFSETSSAKLLQQNFFSTLLLLLNWCKRKPRKSENCLEIQKKCLWIQEKCLEHQEKCLEHPKKCLEFQEKYLEHQETCLER